MNSYQQYATYMISFCNNFLTKLKFVEQFTSVYILSSMQENEL